MPLGYEYPRNNQVSNKAVVVAHGGNATLTADDMGRIHSNTGAAAGIGLTLPPASSVAGAAIRVHMTVAQTIQLIPATGEKVFLGGSGVADKYCQLAAAIGNYLTVFSDGVDWVVTDYSGLTTKQA